MSVLIAKLIWGAGCIAWYVIRYPHQRRSRKTGIVRRVDRTRDRILLAISFCGLFIVPLIFAISGQPKFADYPPQPALVWLGALVFVVSLLVFYRTHRDLGRS